MEIVSTSCARLVADMEQQMTRWFRRAWSRSRLELAALVTALAFVFTTTATIAHAQYRLKPGDRLEFAVRSVPELKETVTIDSAGSVLLPLYGSLKVEGETLAALHDRLQASARFKVWRVRTPDGRENMFSILPSEVAISIAEYTPVYIRGDVAKPGAQTFRPGLTVRQAIALAGGYELARYRTMNPFIQDADFQAEFATLKREAAELLARKSRIEAQLANRPQQIGKDLEHLKLPQEEIATIASAERERARQVDETFQNEKIHYQTLQQQVGEEIDFLSQQKKQVAAGLEQQNADLKKVRELLDRGLAPVNRVLEEQRAIVLTSDRYFQAAAQLERGKRNIQEVRRAEKRLQEKRRLDLIKELQETQAQLDTVVARGVAAQKKLFIIGSFKQDVTDGDAAMRKILIYRKTSGTTAKIAVDEDTNLESGDVVHVTIRPSIADRLLEQSGASQ